MNQGFKKLATAHRLRKEALSWDDMKTTAGEYWRKAKEEFHKHPEAYTKAATTGITTGLTIAALAPKGKKTLAGVIAGLAGITGYGVSRYYNQGKDLATSNSRNASLQQDLEKSQKDVKEAAWIGDGPRNRFSPAKSYESTRVAPKFYAMKDKASKDYDNMTTNSLVGHELGLDRVALDEIKRADFEPGYITKQLVKAPLKAYHNNPKFRNTSPNNVLDK